jgi:hypothetical protein
MVTAPAPRGKFDWQRLVLSLDIPMATKAVALALSVYASKDGSNCHPGNGRLAWAVSADKRTILRHLTVLRDELQLIERTFYGQQAGRRGLSDCYQLVVPWDLAARVKIREYEPGTGDSQVTTSAPDLVTPESPDPDASRDGTGDSGAGTGDSGAGTGDTRVTPPGSTHQVVNQPPADSIVACRTSSPTADVEAERDRQLAALEALMQPVIADVSADGQHDRRVTGNASGRVRQGLDEDVIAAVADNPGCNHEQLQQIVGATRQNFLISLKRVTKAGAVVKVRNGHRVSYELAEL